MRVGAMCQMFVLFVAFREVCFTAWLPIIVHMGCLLVPKYPENTSSKRRGLQILLELNPPTHVLLLAGNDQPLPVPFHCTNRGHISSPIDSWDCSLTRSSGIGPTSRALWVFPPRPQKRHSKQERSWPQKRALLVIGIGGIGRCGGEGTPGVYFAKPILYPK